MEITIDNLYKSYSCGTVVDIPSLSLASGSITCFTGGRGSGKTTLLRMMLGLVRPDRGSVYFDGCNTCSTAAWRLHTGAFIDDSFLVPFYTPQEYFAMIADLYRMDKQRLKDMIDKFSNISADWLEDCGRQIRYLSEENRWKTGLVGAMMVYPKVLVLDEPFRHGSTIQHKYIAEHIQELNECYGTTVVICSDNCSKALLTKYDTVTLNHEI